MTDSGPSIADVLKGTALFSALSDAELESLAARTLIRAYASGELLFSEGALCVGLYIVSKKGGFAFSRLRPAGVNRFWRSKAQAVRSLNSRSSMEDHTRRRSQLSSLPNFSSSPARIFGRFAWSVRKSH
jgi:signal-transduction protein with cAMP-binding, CBS, and nucleotidyltransferase domain